MEKAGDMHFVLGTSWELDSWMDVDKALAHQILWFLINTYTWDFSPLCVD